MSKKYPFLDNWLVDEKESIYEKHLDEFLNQFKASFRPILIKMLNSYTYYNHERTEILFNNFARNLISFISTLPPKPFCITLPIDDDKVHNSERLAFTFKNNPNFKKIVKDSDFINYDYIFVIDDYSGTGGTIINYIKKKKPLFKKDCSVFVAPVIMSDVSEKAFNDSSITIVESVVTTKKAQYYSSQHIIDPSEKLVFDDVSVTFCRVQDRFVNGEGKTEDLFSLSYGTPNNTFGLFWFDANTLYRPLFARSNEQSLQIKAKRQFKHKYIKALNVCCYTNNISSVFDFRIQIAALMAKPLPANEIKESFGLTDHEYNLSVNYLKKKNILLANFQVDINELKKYMDYDQLLLFDEIGIFPKNPKRKKIENDLISLIP